MSLRVWNERRCRFVILPVAGAKSVELKLHISYWACVCRPVASQKLALLFQMRQANHQELMGILEEKEWRTTRLNASQTIIRMSMYVQVTVCFTCWWSPKKSGWRVSMQAFTVDKNFAFSFLSLPVSRMCRSLIALVWKSYNEYV